MKKSIKYKYDYKFNIGQRTAITFLGRDMVVTLIDSSTIKVENP